jgi:hypothetical protein
MDHRIEYIARALYSAEDDAQFWDGEPEILKEEFRTYARAAVALLIQDEEESVFGKGTFQFPHAA